MNKRERMAALKRLTNGDPLWPKGTLVRQMQDELKQLQDELDEKEE